MNAKATLLCKLKKNDSTVGKDVWYKYFLSSVEYKETSIANVNGQTVSMGKAFTVLLPFSDRYVIYDNWKEMMNKQDFYTLSANDVLIIGEHIEEDVTAQNIVAVKANHNLVCEIRSIDEVPKNGIAKYQFKIAGV